jgi:hypothetical protein
VAQLVNECSESALFSEDSWYQRKEKYLANFCAASSESRRIMLADKLHNARSNLVEYYQFGADFWQFFKTGKSGMLWFYRSLLESINLLGEHRILAIQLETIVNQLEET